MEAAVIVIVTVDDAAVHGPAASGSFVFNVKITEPLAIPGVYVEVREVESLNVPLEALQVELVALPPMEPDKLTSPTAQTVCGEPAFAVAGL